MFRTGIGSSVFSGVFLARSISLTMWRSSQHLIVVIVLVFSLTMTSYADGFSSEPISTVNFFSWTPKSFAEIFSGERHGRRVFAFGTLVLPDTDKSQRVPAVIFLHGSAGDAGRRRMRMAQMLTGQGIASLVVETFQSRILYQQQGYLSRLRKSFVHAQLADAYAALQILQAHPLIDGSRISLSGASMGGMTAYLAANERVAQALAPDGSRFKAHITYYAPCSVRYQTMKTTGAPILMLAGKLDEGTPPGDCEHLAADLEAAGSKVKLVAFDTAAHAWDGLQPKKFHPEFPNPAPCRFTIQDDGNVFEARTGLDAMDVPAIVDVLVACSSDGYTMGRDEEAVTASDRMLIEFLQKTFDESH